MSRRMSVRADAWRRSIVTYVFGECDRGEMRAQGGAQIIGGGATIRFVR